MREIKFRAWNTDNLRFAPNFNVIIPTERDGKTHRFEPADNVILMQYTGLKDKNGKEIYEGDIVVLLDLEHDEELLITSVKWSEQGLNFNVYPCHNPKENWLVIGNIYENPELMEK